MAKREIYNDLMERMQELQAHQNGKITLKSHKVTRRTPVTIAPEELRSAREKLNLW